MDKGKFVRKRGKEVTAYAALQTLSRTLPKLYTLPGVTSFVLKEEKMRLKERLTPEQYDVCVNKGTERPFTGEYWNGKEKGVYQCLICGNELFSSETKFDSRTGWPSF